MTNYPEHEKLQAISKETQAIGEFLEFSGYQLCQWNNKRECFDPVPGSTSKILAEYFDIDQNRLEAEKRQMLEAIRG